MILSNFINIGKSVLLAHIFNKKTPVNVMWTITEKCNYNCSYCKTWRREKKELKTQQVLSLIDQLAKCGTQRIGFVGGEAFLREDFDKILDYVKSKGIYVTLVSNGSLVPENMRLVKKLDCLVLSLDGRKENHDRVRIKGSFDDVMKALDACGDEDIKVLTNTVLSKYNLTDIDYILDLAKKKKFKCTFNVLIDGGNLYPTNKKYKETFDYLIQKKKEGAPIVLSIKTMKFLRNWHDYRKYMSKKKLKGFTCWAGKLLFNIDADGRISACTIIKSLVDSPKCTEVEFKKACNLVQKNGCKACISAHVIEYNYLFSLRPSVILDWSKFIFGK